MRLLILCPWDSVLIGPSNRFWDIQNIQDVQSLAVGQLIKSAPLPQCPGGYQRQSSSIVWLLWSILHQSIHLELLNLYNILRKLQFTTKMLSLDKVLVVWTMILIATLSIAVPVTENQTSSLIFQRAEPKAVSCGRSTYSMIYLYLQELLTLDRPARWAGQILQESRTSRLRWTWASDEQGRNR